MSDRITRAVVVESPESRPVDFARCADQRLAVGSIMHALAPAARRFAATWLAFLAMGVFPLWAADRGTPWDLHVIDNTFAGADGVRLADVNGDGQLDITTGFEEGNAIRAFLHPGEANVENPWPAVTVGTVAQTEDAFFVDLDDDGAMDVVSSGQGTQRIFIHWAPTPPGDYMNPVLWQTASIPASVSLGYGWIFSTAMQVDGLNGADIISGGQGPNAKIVWFKSPAGNRRNLSNWTMNVMSNVDWTMSLIPYDVDNDTDLDVIVTDRFNGAGLEGARWLENPGTGLSAQMSPWSNHFIGAQGKQPMLSVMADLDCDGLDDLLVPTQTATGLSFFRRLDRVQNSWQEYHINQPANTGIAKGCNVGDIDLDGDPDIVFSFSVANSPKSGVVWMSYANGPTDATWVDHEISGPLGIKYDIVALVDLDGDGDLDVITTEENEGAGSRGLGTIWYENPTAPIQPEGVPGDFDHDDDVDMEDFGHLQACLTGSGVTELPPGCADAQLDEDEDVDAQDVDVLRGCLSGSNQPAEPGCAGGS